MIYVKIFDTLPFFCPQLLFLKQNNIQMKNLHHSALWLILLAFLFSCNTTQKVATDTSIDFTILQINDVYEIAPLEGGKAGGMARVAQVKQELLKENPNTIAMLAGDFLSPSLMATVKMENGERIAGLQMVETLNAMGMDYVTFGNHEFDLSDLETLQKRIDQSTFEYTTCNAFMVKNGQTMPFTQKIKGEDRPIPKYLIREFKNPAGQSMKIGVLGVVLPFNQQDYVAYTDVEESFKTTLAELKPQVDVVIALTHLAIDEDMDLAGKVSGVPLFIGGHDHVNMKHKVKNTVITKADANAKTVYIHRLQYFPATKKVELKSELKKIDDQIPDEPRTQAVVDKWSDNVNAILEGQGYQPARKLMVADTPLECTEAKIRTRQTNFGSLTTKAMANAIPGGDIYMINSGSMRLDDDISGTVVEYDVLRTFPFGGGITKMELKGEVVNELLNIGLFTNQGEGGYMQVFKVDGDKDQWTINGQPLDKNKTYSVVLPEFVAGGREANLSMLGDYSFDKAETLSVAGNTVKNDIRDIVIQFMLQLKK
jgi:2',3'-cyclic-nucleotide 2'-phosphodiesterase (5'-nucleotidase family)